MLDSREDNFFIGRILNLELSLHQCLEVVGIFRLIDWDVLAFVYRHGVSLTSAEQIARLIGYENTVVGRALDRLEHGYFIERSRCVRGVRFYRTMALTDPQRERCLQYLISLVNSRAGRLLLTQELQSISPQSDRSKQITRAHGLEGSNYA